MPAPTITTRKGAWLLTDMAPGEYEALGDFLPSIPDTGWDTGEIDYLYLLDTAETVADMMLEFTPLTKLDITGVDMYITQARPTCIGPRLYKVNVQAKGQYIDKGYRFRIRSHEDIQSAENIEISAVTYPKVSVSETAPEVEAIRVYIGQRPAVNLIGTAQTPGLAEALTVRTSGWLSLADPVYHFPNGWVLASQEIEEFVPSDASPATDGAFLETLVFQYRYPYTP